MKFFKLEELIYYFRQFFPEFFSTLFLDFRFVFSILQPFNKVNKSHSNYICNTSLFM